MVAKNENWASDFMVKAYAMRRELDEKANPKYVPHNTNVVITNYTTQSVANRSGAFEVISDLEVNGEVIHVETCRFMPSRVLKQKKDNTITEASLGYAKENVEKVKGGSGGYWDILARGGLIFGDRVNQEVLALVCYFFDTANNGFNSSESGFKVGLLDLFLKTAKPKKWTISIRYENGQEIPYVYQLSHIKSFVAGKMPRFTAILEAEDKVRQRARRGRNLVVKV